MKLWSSVYKSSLVLGVIVLLGCGGQAASSPVPQQTGGPAPSSAPEFASHIIQNAKIYTLNPQQPWAQAIAIKDNRIIFVGSNEGVKQFVEQATQVEDAKGKMLLPGIHDVHSHAIENYGFQFSLDNSREDIEHTLEQIIAADQANPGFGWLIGYNHLLESVMQAGISPMLLLDDILPHRPAIIMDNSSHSMWVNSLALELLGLDDHSADPLGGFLGREVKTGKLNGILFDNAGNIALDLAFKQIQADREEAYQVLVNFTLPEYARYGITSTLDARTFWQRGDHYTWLRAAEEQALTMRVSVALWAYPELDDKQQLAALKQAYNLQAEDLLRIDHVKLYMDGVVENTTAALNQPYLIKPWGDVRAMPDNKGLNYFTQTRLEKYLTELEPIGFDFLIHAIGDRGIHQALNGIEKASSGKNRHQLTHLQLIDPKDIARFKGLNVTADIQVAGEDEQLHHWYLDSLGAERANRQHPLKSLQDSGANLTLSSDWTVSSLNPFVGMKKAVTRKYQALTLKQAIEAYTINGAYALSQEALVGSLEVGKRADLIMLDRNLFEIKAEHINQTKVLKTMVDGMVVYQK